MTVLIAAAAQALAVVFLISGKSPTDEKMKILLASGAILSGAAVLFNIYFVPFKKETQVLRYALILNPCASLIFIGAGLILRGWSIFSSIFLILGVLLMMGGFGLLNYHLFSRRREPKSIKKTP